MIFFAMPQDRVITGQIVDGKHIEYQVDEIKSRASRLLALCIWVELPLDTFRSLLNDGLWDDDLPLGQNFAHPLIDATSSKLLLECQTHFTPYTIRNDGLHHDFAAGLPFPILFEESDDRIGRGSFSDVFRVKVDSDVSLSSQKNFFALKRFKTSDEAETIFQRERLLLEELRKRPHDHIVTHISSMMDHGTFYILFPLAQCNLRTFLNRTTAPSLHGDMVVWFFSQLKGLADALLHLHALGDPGAKPQWTPTHEFIPSRPVLHGDIKPENILIFTSTSEASLGTFKLSDLGSAQTSSTSQEDLPAQRILFRGTEAYESPDLRKSSDLSCANDIWSLACVFLELFVWLFYPPGSEETGFMTQRSCDTLSRSSSFFKLGENEEVQLKPSVWRRLMDLEKNPHCAVKLAFGHLLHLLWKVLYPNPAHERFSTVQFLHDIEACIAQANLDLTRDPNFYLDPTTVTTGTQATPLPSWFKDRIPLKCEPQPERWRGSPSTNFSTIISHRKKRIPKAFSKMVCIAMEDHRERLRHYEALGMDPVRSYNLTWRGEQRLPAGCE